MPSAPFSPHRAPVMSSLSPMRWRQAPFIYPGRDGPARGQGLVVAQERVLAGQVLHAGIGAASLLGGKSGGVRFGGDIRGNPAFPKKDTLL